MNYKFSVHSSIPVKFKNKVKDTYVPNSRRQNKCPIWSSNSDTVPPTGSMSLIRIPEDTKVGTEVYRLSATDNEPVYYFIRPNDQTPNEEVIFNVTTFRDGQTGFIGK